MDISRHAIARIQQRGIPKDLVDLIMEFGTPQLKPGGAIEYSVRKKDKNRMIGHLKHLINRLDKIANKGVLIIDDHVITTYHKKQ
jgi:hypothetical protein